MKCKISCSFGEIIDKISILKIKKSKALDKNVLSNINNELETIINEIPESKNNDSLFDDIFKINNKLWILEDLIREKSKKKEFDNDYIKYAEQIHITNDERYQIKKKINEKYNSELKEEKIYNKKTENKVFVTENDFNQLESAKLDYINGNFKKSYFILNKLVEKFNNYDIFDNFYVDLLFSYSNIVNIYNYDNKYYDKIKYIIENLSIIEIDIKLKEFCKKQFLCLCLDRKNYKLAHNYINLLNDITGPNVSYKNMSFFKKEDKNKTLLIYDGGGIGDKFMFCRFIPKLCNEYKNNKIIFFINDNLCWIFNKIFNFNNLQIIPYTKNFLLNNFDYHCSLIYLLKSFNIEYHDLYFEPMFKNLNGKISNFTEDVIENIKKNSKKTFILNWKGNKINPHEKSNRGMSLEYALPLFKLTNINWLIITKDLTNEEKEILIKNNIKYIGDKIDNTGNCFEESVEIIKNVNGVISTDTSISHLSLNLNIPTYVLLTIGCEWRWTKDNKTNWYPNSILIRQKEYGDWNYVISELCEKLNFI